MKKEKITVDIGSLLKKALNQYCNKYGQSLSYVVRKAISDIVSEDKRKR